LLFGRVEARVLAGDGRLQRDGFGEPELVGGELVMLSEPCDSEAADALAFPAHRLDEDRFVRHQARDRMLEPRVLLAVDRVHWPLDAAPIAPVALERLDA